MNKTTPILLGLSVLLTFGVVGTSSVHAWDVVVDDDYAFDIVIDESVGGFATHGGNQWFSNQDGGFVASSFEDVEDFVTSQGQVNAFYTSIQDIEIKDSVDVVTQYSFGGIDVTITDGLVAILSSEVYQYYLNAITQGEDENSAPHLGGFNTRDADRVLFSGMIEQPTIVMSNTEIHVLAGKAIEPVSYVFFDGKVIDVIATNYQEGQKWNGIGGNVIDIPFEAYYHVTDEGQLIHKGAGYQNVFRDLDGMRTFQLNSESVDRQLPGEIVYDTVFPPALAHLG